MDRANIHLLEAESPPGTKAALGRGSGQLHRGERRPNLYGCGVVSTDRDTVAGKPSPSVEILTYFNAFCREFVSHDAI
jgi:hypothetical protein